MAANEESRTRYVEPKKGFRGRVAGTDLLLAALCAVAALSVYVRTLSASIAWGDSPELTSAAFQAGVPHPTGYPLYMLLAHGFLTLFRWGSVAQRMNLLSALSGAGGVGLLFLVARRAAGSRACAAVAALLFAFSLTFWSQSVIAEVYAFHVLLNAAALLCVLQWDRTGSGRWPGAAALAYGLCFTHHLMSVLLAPALLYFALTSPRRGAFARALPWTLPLFLAPLLLYGYLPLAALRDPAANWGDPRNLHNFLLHVTGGIYRHSMFHQPPVRLWRSLVQYAGPVTGPDTGLLLSQWGLGLLPLAPVGLWSLFRLRRRLFWLTLIAYVTVVVYALNYDIFDVEVYYIPAHLITAIWIGCGLRRLGAWLHPAWRRLGTPPGARRRLMRVLSVALLLLPAVACSENWSANDLSRDWSALSYAHAVFDALPPHAVALAAGDREYFPLVYVSRVEKRRPDVILVSQGALTIPEYLRLTTRLRGAGLVVNVPPDYFPPGARKADDAVFWRQLIQDNIRQRPVVMIGRDNMLDPALLAAGFFPQRRTNLPLREIRLRPPAWDAAPAAPARPADVLFRGPDPELQLVGWDAEPHRHGDVLWLRIRYYWKSGAPAALRGLRVWGLFGDETGSYDHLDNGEPAMANIHDLGQGAQYGAAAPPRFRETAEIAVPRSQYGKALHFWLGVAREGKFLPIVGRMASQVDLGPLPALPAPPAAGAESQR